MKKIFSLLFVTTFLFASCSDDGDPGPQGPPGEDGVNIVGKTIELPNINFTENNNYSVEINFNNEGVEVLESDAVLVYLKDGEDGVDQGAPVNVYRLLPQTYYVDSGEIQYNYDFTYRSTIIFMDGTADFTSLDPVFTDNVTLRIIVVPSNFLANSNIDIADYQAVSKALNINENTIRDIQIQQ